MIGFSRLPLLSLSFSLSSAPRVSWVCAGATETATALLPMGLDFFALLYKLNAASSCWQIVVRVQSAEDAHIAPSTIPLIDILAVVSIGGLLCCADVFFPRVFRAGTRWFNDLAGERAFAVACTGGLALLGGSALTAIFGTPLPAVHDEFSYLLAGDTFAHGRLTNPQHPLSFSFETMHVNVRPTYHSIYPPAQGAALALGQVLVGEPIFGVWLSMAAACAALCWMLQSWLPPRWAFFGAIVATVKLVFAAMPAPSLFQPGYWSNSYWGGAVPMLGGALVLGASRRLAKQSNAITSAVLGIGCTILANSRPFEGLVVVLIAFGYLTIRVASGPAGMLKRLFVRSVPAFLAVVIPTVAFMLYYNFATTGDPLLRPYDLSSRDYAVTPASLLQPLRPPPEYRHEMIRRYHLEVAKPQFLKQTSPAGYLAEKGEKAVRVWSVLCGPILTLPLLASALTLRSRTTRFALLGLLVVAAALMPMSWLQPHYLAPIAAVFFLLVVQGVRAANAFCRRRRWTAAIFGAALLAGLCVSTAVTLYRSAARERKGDWSLLRAEVIRRLHDAGGRHLLLVAYDDQYSPHWEWVYNGADIDASEIVWARESTEDDSERLITYFSDRKAWRLRISFQGYRLTPVNADPE